MTDTITTPTLGDLEWPDPEPAAPAKPRRRRRAARPKPEEQQPQRHHATGAGMRLGGDHPAFFYIEVIGTIAVAVAAFTISVTGLLAVARWQHTPDLLHFLTPVMVDLPIAVFTTMTITFKYREQLLPMWFARILSFVFAGFSSVANFLHTASVGGLDGYEAIIGATFNGVAPLIVLACTELLGHLITRPKRNTGRLRKQTVRDLKRVQKELQKRLRALDAADAKVLRG